MDATETRIVVSFDTETALIRTGHLLPEMVCAAFAWRDGEKVETRLLHANDPTLPDHLVHLFEDPAVHIVGSNVAYDCGVSLVRFPYLSAMIWQAYEDGRLHDISIVEKLKMISTVGDARFGQTAFHTHSQLDQEKQYLGVDRNQEKMGENAWRLRYGELMDVPLVDWPEDAKDYPCNDVIGALLVYEAQLASLRPEGYGSAKPEPFQTAVDFALKLMSAWGMHTDPERVDKLDAKLKQMLSPARMQPLVDAGLLTMAIPGHPKRDGTLTASKPEKKNDANLREYVRAACIKYGVEMKMTGNTNPAKQKPSADGEQVAKLADSGDKLMELFGEREDLRTTRDNYLPVVKNPIVYFNYDVLVNTGRTSSYGSEHYPSTSGQKLPRIDGEYSTRECFVAREGKILISSDYHALELCSVAQVTYELLEKPGICKSIHREKINAGYDLHAYLGSHLATKLDPGFGKLVMERHLSVDDAYAAFKAMKGSDDKKVSDFYEHWRMFAKPTGLGYPGGLGPRTFMSMAKKDYGITVSLDMAETLRAIWRNAYPEMRQFLDWVSGQHDDQNHGRLAYQTPLGMYRAGCLFTEAANGIGMQSRSAEGAKAAVFELSRLCYDPSRDSLLYGCRPVNFVHDEIIVEAPDDDLTHERACIIRDVMVEAMRLVMPDVIIRAEPVAMRRWFKGAKPKFDIKGRLIVWEPRSAA